MEVSAGLLTHERPESGSLTEAEPPPLRAQPKRSWIATRFPQKTIAIGAAAGLIEGCHDRFQNQAGKRADCVVGADMQEAPGSA